MRNHQKNDVVSLMGCGFSRSMDPRDFSHDTAVVTHTLLHESSTRVLLIQYLPSVEKGNTRMVYTVGEAVFSPVHMIRHNSPGKTEKMQTKTMNAINLVQIAILPTWSGRNLGTIVMAEAIPERLREAGYDLMIICGCTQSFDRRLGLPSNPDWLKASPFKLDVPEMENHSQQMYNLELFFYQVALNQANNENRIAKPAAKGCRFLFEFSFE